MLIQTDKNELGDKRLDPTENLAKLKEENAQLTAKSKIKDQSLLENKDMAIGSPMEWSGLVYLLKKMNTQIIIEDGGVRNALAVRYPGKLADGTFGKRYVTGFYKEVMPEFSCILSDERGRATRECRGWRTVVLALIRQGIIRYKDAVETFGNPTVSAQDDGRNYYVTNRRYKIVTRTSKHTGPRGNVVRQEKTTMSESKQVALTAEDLQAILATVIAESKKPSPPTEEEQKKLAQAQENRKRTALRHGEIVKAKEWAQKNCTHMRRDGTSRAVYVKNGNYLHCQKCHVNIRPEADEAKKSNVNSIYDDGLFSRLFQMATSSAIMD